MDAWELKYNFITELLNEKGLRYVDSGSTRDTYMSKSGLFVVKVPRDPVFQDDNYNEAITYKNTGGIGWDDETRYAKCRLFTFHGVKLVIMETVEVIRHPEWYEAPLDLPEWINYLDNKQVGYDRQGRLVAYDYA